MAFHFDDDMKARAVFENIRLLTCRLGSIEKLYAFNYSSNAAEREIKGWDLYNPSKEFERMGISETGTHKAWRISTINSKFAYCDTYPALICVPTIISDTTLKHTASFRSKARIPALTYLHALNGCTITRSAQPNVGVRLSRSAQDEKLVGAIFSSTKPSVKPLRSAPATPRNHQSSSDLSQIEDIAAEIETLNIPPKAVDDSIENISPSQSSLEVDQFADGKIYGAQQTNLIIDARPRVNAIANHAKGFGSERIEGYKGAEVRFLGIENIHVMRNSLNKVVEVLKDSDLTAFAPNRNALEKSGWRKHINYLLLGTRLVANTIAIQHSHVLIHCSDGWDRTSQLSALAQLCLDPYYRTIKGFIVLIEKDWVSFGHMFRLRSGLLGHESWFEIENDRAAAYRSAEDGAAEPEPATNAFETGFSRVQRFFARRNEDDEADADPQPAESPAKAHHTKISETSPVFHQFLDATYQLMRQNPTRFEFNERFLRRLLYHLYSCQYGNFLCNSEKERLDNKIKDRTKSVWGYFLSRQSQFTNESYDPEINEKFKEKSSLLEFNPNDIRWWHELFGRTDEEMNGTTAPPPPNIGDTLDGTQSSNDSGEGSFENLREKAEFGTVSNVESVGRVTVSSGAPFSTISTEAMVATEAPGPSSNISDTPTKISNPPISSANPLFARLEDSPSRPPLDSEDVTYLANMDSPKLRTDPVTISRSTTPRSARPVATIRDSSQDSQGVSGLFGRTKKEPLDVEMR
jgi:myotubularin-related protein 6/7/8